MDSCISPFSSAGFASSIAPRTSSSSIRAVTKRLIRPISSHTAPRHSAISASAAYSPPLVYGISIKHTSAAIGTRLFSIFPKSFALPSAPIGLQ